MLQVVASALSILPVCMSFCVVFYILLLRTAAALQAASRGKTLHAPCRRLTRALTAQISVALSSPYARQAVLAAARHLCLGWSQDALALNCKWTKVHRVDGFQALSNRFISVWRYQDIR